MSAKPPASYQLSPVTVVTVGLVDFCKHLIVLFYLPFSFSVTVQYNKLLFNVC